MGVVSLVVCCALLSFVLAAKSGAIEASDVKANADSSGKNMTFGQCVSERAQIKNDCLSAVKATRATCVANVTDDASCRVSYKKDLAQCKSAFKLAKKECGKIKHSAFAGMRYALS